MINGPKTVKGFKRSPISFVGDDSFDYRKAITLNAQDDDRVILPNWNAVEVFDQGDIGSCEANAWAAALELLMPTPIALSRLSLYWRARLFDGTLPNDEGTMGQTVYFVLKETGVEAEELWPYDGRPENEGGSLNVRPSLSALENAYDHKIDAAHRIVTTGKARERDVKASILAGRPVQIGGDVGPEYQDFFQWHSAAVAFDAPTNIVGGHAQVIVGFWDRPDGTTWYLVRNSWGRFGLVEFPGHAWYTASALNALDELFSVYKAPKV